MEFSDFHLTQFFEISTNSVGSGAPKESLPISNLKSEFEQSANRWQQKNQSFSIANLPLSVNDCRRCRSMY